MGKIIKGFITIILATVFMSAGVYAAFSTQSVNKGNVIKTGTIKLIADSDIQTSGLQTVPLFDDLQGIKAGDTNSRVLFIYNNGSLGLTYNGQVYKSSGDDALFSSFNLKVGTTVGAGDLYNGSMSGFNGFLSSSRYLAAGTGENLYFELTLPADSGESLREKSLSFDFSFSASQAP